MQVTLDAFMAYNNYTMDKIAQRRKEPTEDLISVLVHAAVDGQRLSDNDILQETLLILVGGDETTRHTISGGIEQLIRHPKQWELLQRNPDLVPIAIEEMLRWTSPLKNMARTITADTDSTAHLQALPNVRGVVTPDSWSGWWDRLVAQ